MLRSSSAFIVNLLLPFSGHTRMVTNELTRTQRTDTHTHRRTHEEREKHTHTHNQHSFDVTVIPVVNLLLKYTVKPQTNARKRQ